MNGILMDIGNPFVIIELGYAFLIVLTVGMCLIGLCIFLIVYNVKKANRKKEEKSLNQQGGPIE